MLATVTEHEREMISQCTKATLAQAALCRITVAAEVPVCPDGFQPRLLEGELVGVIG